MADKNNYLSRVTYQGGKDSYEFPFSYLRKDFVKAQINLSERESNTLAYMVDYTIDGHTLNLTKPVDADKTITIYRETSSTPLVEYEDSSILRAYDLNLSQRQNLNILEEQTDIVGKNYSLTLDTKDYMYKNLVDTKTAIDNKMSETLDTVNASVSMMNDTVNTTKKSVEDSLAEMNTTVANTKKSVEESLATTTTNLNDTLNTATSLMDSKISQASQALEDAKANLETTKSDIEKALADTQDSMKATENRVNETEADITKLAAEFKESESSLRDAISNVSTTNRNMAYEVGDQIHSSYLPFNCYITCVTAGTTGDTLPVIPEGDHDSGFTFTDGTATFKMDYWPLSINGKKPLNKAGNITIDTVDNAAKATNDKNGADITETYLKKAGDTATGAIIAPSFQTGTDEANYFQCKKFRGEGNADNYYHAVDFGCSGHDQVDFYEYGGTWNFWYTRYSNTKNGGKLIGSIKQNGWNGNVVGDVTGNAATATNADKLDGYHASDIINRITAANTGGIVAASLTENGYVKFANGLILQWGTGDNDKWISFPIAFNNFARVICTCTNGAWVWADNVGRTGFNFKADGVGAWIAVGV